MRRYLKIPFGCLFLAITLLACDPNRIFENSIPVQDMKWDKDDLAAFEFPVEDTSARYNMYISLRNTPEYPYSNIYFFVQLVAPDQKYSLDTIPGTLADNQGRWLGEGSGNLWEHRIVYKTEVQFPIKGQYKITIAHGMRENPLPAISDIGFRIETADHHN